MLDEKAPTVTVDQPEGQLTVTFVDGDEAIVGSERYVANRVDYRGTIRFRLEGGAWVHASDTYVRRAQFSLSRDGYPSDSARKKIWAAYESALHEALASDPDICRRARAYRLRRDIASQRRQLAEVEAKAAGFRSAITELEQQLAAVEPPEPAPQALDPEQCPGCGKLGDDCVCGLDVDGNGPAEPEDSWDQSDVPMAHELADDEQYPGAYGVNGWNER